MAQSRHLHHKVERTFKEFGAVDSDEVDSDSDEARASSPCCGWRGLRDPAAAGKDTPESTEMRGVDIPDSAEL